MHEYLTGKDKSSGAHKRYSKPGEMTFSQCFHAMAKAQRKQLRQTFDNVIKCMHLLLMSPARCRPMPQQQQHRDL